ncbi:MAG TPA: hypothetical protein VJ892_05030 [Candidatus Absconditabacterales bacterium]|nr:hypothetical protein [Candidatus Absconditabacterales bacterium]
MNNKVSVDQPDLINEPSIQERTDFNGNVLDGRGLPKLGKKYELQLALHQWHKDGLEKEFKNRFFENIESLENFEDLMKDLCQLFGIDSNNFTVADAKILLPSYNSTGYDAQVSMLGLGSGNYDEYFKPVFKKEEDGEYTVAIQDSTEGVYLTEHSKGSLWGASIKQAFAAYRNHKRDYYNHLLNMTKYIDQYPSDSLKSKAMASMDFDLTAKVLGVDLEQDISEGEVFRFLPKYVNYIPKYAGDKNNMIQLVGHLQYDESNKQYSLQYIVGENSFKYGDERKNITVGDKIIEIKGESLQQIVRSAYDFFYSNSDLFAGDQFNIGEKDETELRNNLRGEFSSNKKENLNNLLLSYNSTQDDAEKKEIQEYVSSVVNVESSAAYVCQYYLCLSVLFDLPEDIQKTLALQSIQSGLIGKLIWHPNGMSLNDVRKKKGIDLVENQEHVLKQMYTIEDVEKIAQGFNITDEELSKAILDVYLLHKIGKDNHGFIKSYHINSHNTSHSEVTKDIISLLNKEDLDYIKSLELASGSHILKEDNIANYIEDKQTIHYNANDFPSILGDIFSNSRNRKILDKLCDKFNIPVEQIAQDHKSKYDQITQKASDEIQSKIDDDELDLSAFCYYLEGFGKKHELFSVCKYSDIRQLFNMLIKDNKHNYTKKDAYKYFIDNLEVNSFVFQELYSKYKQEITKTSKEYCDYFKSFERDVKESNRKGKYPEQPLFLVEQGDSFIVTDDFHKYGEEFVSTIEIHNYEDGYGETKTIAYMSDNNSYFAPKGMSGGNYYKKRLDSRDNKYLGAIIKSMPEEYQKDFEEGKLEVKYLIK